MLAAKPSRSEIGREDAIPSFKADLKCRVILRVDRASIIVDNVDPTQLTMDTFIGSPNLLLIRKVYLKHKRANSMFFPVDANDDPALIGKPPGNSLP